MGIYNTHRWSLFILPLRALYNIACTVNTLTFLDILFITFIMYSKPVYDWTIVK